MDMPFVEELEKARVLSGVPFVINSGYRCPSHNASVGGKPTSAHLAGKAVDISSMGSLSRFKIISSSIQAGFSRIGIGRTFVHIDSDDTKPSSVIWDYY